MIVVNQNTALLLFAIIIIISIILAWYMKNFDAYDKSPFHSFIAILGGLGVFVTFLFYYALMVTSFENQNLTNAQENLQINKLNTVFEEIKQSSEIIPYFILSITPLTSPSNYLSSDVDTINPKTYAAKISLSFKIFALWEDVVISHKNDHLSYITKILQRANSKQLYEQWTLTKLNFTTNTQIYGDLLFEYGLSICEQIPLSYITVGKKLIEDPRYIKIFD